MSIKSLTSKKTLTLAAATLLLAACASAPMAPEGSEQVRAKLTALQSNGELASRAPIEIRDAATAVAAAERPQDDEEQADHLVLIADQKVDIATAWAQSRLYESQRAALRARTEQVRLEARTREAEMARGEATAAQRQAQAARDEARAAQMAAQAARDEASSALSAADIARDQAAMARNEANQARTATNLARDQAAAAQNEANAARAEAAELQRQITELNGRQTDRGLVVTLGDVLFETGMAELRGSAVGNLDRLADFLVRYDTRTAMIEGHTDSVGSESSNQILSQRRAQSVQAYLISRGVSSARLNASGLGEGSPVGSNDSETGRQQNRRVEVIVSNPEA